MKGTLPEAMLFDLDGTLFQTETLLMPAYYAMFDQLRAEGLHTGETPPDHLILGGLGMLLDEIWRRVLPDASVDVHRRADTLLLQYQLEGLSNGVGELYPEVANTLQELHARGVKLFVASNGLEHYVKGVIRAHGLESLFTGLYSAGEYETKSKVDLVRILLMTHGISHAWMVGDRLSDVEAGHKNGLPVVGCHYAAFGKPEELAAADMNVTAFPELLKLLDRLDHEKDG